MNNLSSYQEIKSLSPIPGADLVELAKFKDIAYQCVVQKGSYKVGDKIIYIEYDSIVPVAPWSDFLQRNTPPEPQRIKPKKIRGVMSHGLVLPIDILQGNHVNFDDLDNYLGIKKYSKPVPLQMDAEVLREFPSFIPKTDELRLQSKPYIAELLRGHTAFVTEKIDGTSATFYLNYNHFGVCSRNRELKPDDQNVFWKIAKDYDIERKLRDFGGSVAFQGEIYGPNIQGNRLDVKRLSFALFNIFYIDKGEYESYAISRVIADDLLIPTVPLIRIYQNNQTLKKTAQHWIDEYSNPIDGQSKINPSRLREGVVVRSTKESYTHYSDRISFKIISQAWEQRYEC